MSLSASSRSVLIVGAGVLGAACAHVFARAGWRAILVDDGRSSASAAAAGMLAPAFEAVLDDADLTRADLLRAARDRWPAIAEACGVELIRDGAGWRAYDESSAAKGRVLTVRLSALGFNVEGPANSPFTPDDWRLDPEDALAALARPARRVAARVVRAGADDRRGWIELADGDRLTADQLVLASGVGQVECGPAEPAFQAVQPIKGQIVSARIAPPQHVLRTTGAYVTPSGAGVRVGATMEAGRTDQVTDPAVTAELLAVATRIWPPSERASDVLARAAVRGASPDGLPLAGPVSPRISVALAPRRNGWLLAPLVAEIVAAYCCGTDPGPYAAAFQPLRFAPGL